MESDQKESVPSGEVSSEARTRADAYHAALQGNNNPWIRRYAIMNVVNVSFVGFIALPLSLGTVVGTFTVTLSGTLNPLRYALIYLATCATGGACVALACSPIVLIFSYRAWRLWYERRTEEEERIAGDENYRRLADAVVLADRLKLRGAALEIEERGVSDTTRDALQAKRAELLGAMNAARTAVDYANLAVSMAEHEEAHGASSIRTMLADCGRATEQVRAYLSIDDTALTKKT